MHIMVIGSGLGGLCLAQGLVKAGIEVDVYEKDLGITARFQGHRIGLDERGLTALSRCLPADLLPLLEATLGDLHGERRILDSALKHLGQLPPLRATAADRHVLRHLMLTGLDGHLHAGKELTGYHVLSDGKAQASFADGTTATADAIVGADGINSAVRAVLSPDTVPTDTGVRAVIGRTQLTERFATLVPGFGTQIIGAEANLVLGLMTFRTPPRVAAAKLAPHVALPATADYVRWVMLLPPGESVAARTPDAAQDAVLSRTEGWHDDVRALIRSADTDNSSVLQIRVVKPGARWQLGPVTLLGDAAHATSPSGGNGANTALRDADLLRSNLINVALGNRDLYNAIDEYEQHMLDYGAKAVEHSLAALPHFTTTAGRETATPTR